MRVILIIDNLIKGGRERRLLELLKYFEDVDNYEILLILLKDQIDYPVVRTLKRTTLKVLRRRVKKDPSVFVKLWKVVKDFKPDLIHSWGTMPSIYIAPICYFQKIPFLNAMISDTSSKYLSQSWLRAKITFPFSDCILANSYSGLEAYKVPFNKGHVIYNGVHLDRFVVNSTPESIREKIGIKTEFVVGMVAAFHPRKDYVTFVKAAIDILNKKYDVTFVAVGNGETLQEIETLVPDKNKDKIIFLGEQDNVEELIQIFDIGIITTNYKLHKEGISNSIIEYMAMGKPVIATYGGGTNEIVDNNINGLMISPFDYLGLSAKIESLILDSEKRLLLGENGKLKITQGFRIDVMANNYHELYKSLVKNRE